MVLIFCSTRSWSRVDLACDYTRKIGNLWRISASWWRLGALATNFEAVRTAMTCSSCSIQQLKVLHEGLYLWKFNAFAHNLRTRNDLGCLDWLMMRHFDVLFYISSGSFSLGLGSSLHNLTNFMSSICSLHALELLFFDTKGELRDWFGIWLAYYVNLGIVHA